MRRRATWLIAALAWAYATQAHAAWVQSKGKSLIISSLSEYRADARFDSLARRAPASAYRKQELSVYGVYGLTEKLTLGAQPSFFRLRAASAPGGRRQGMNGFSHIELFARARLLTGDFWVVSAQALVKLPGPDAPDREPLLEASSSDLEGRLLFGQSGRLAPQWLNLKYFTSLEAGYRLRGAHAADQWRGDASFGVTPMRNYQIIIQSFNIVSVRYPDGSDPTAYDLYKAQVSVVRDLPHGLGVQVGGFREYTGRNIGAGNALFAAIWSRF